MKKQNGCMFGFGIPFLCFFGMLSSGNHVNFVRVPYIFPKLYILVLVPLCSLDHVDGVGHVKLYIAPVPRTATEADVSFHFP